MMWDIVFFCCVIMISLYALAAEWTVRTNPIVEILIRLLFFFGPLYMVVYSIAMLYEIAKL